MAMANYDIPQYPTKRLRYFNNQFLKEQDFIDVDAARIGHERAVLRSLCVAGVCEGLVVTYPAPNKPPSVSAGVAVDKTGRMIVIDQPTDGPANPSALADGDYFVHISFLESEDDKATGQGAPDYTRWKQTPVINATAKTAALPDGVVVLGSCTVTGGAFVGSGTTIGRQHSGLRLPGPNKDATATLRNNGTADDLAVLAGSLTVRRDVHAQLGPTLTLSNLTGGAGAGGAIDFNGCDPGTNDPTLRVRSLDDGNYSSHLTFATKQSGAVTNKLVERLRLTSNGLLQFSNDSPKDKLVIYDNGATNRFGIGLNDSNINLFYPTNARFSLRQNSSSGTEVFSVSGSGAATIRRDVTGQLGPTLTLLNGAGSTGAGSAIDFNGYDPGTNDPSLRIQSLDDGNASSHLTFSTKQSGVVTNKLVERLRLTSDGLLQFPTDSKDKIVISDNGTERYGIGLNSSNINLFCPTSAHFSLRQNSTSGTEVFWVDGAGNITTTGNLRMRKRLITLGTTDGGGAGVNEIVGGIGFMGTGQTHGELAYRAARGFEFVDTTRDGPHIPYNIGAYPYADIYCGDVTATKINNVSDLRLKRDIETLTGALQKVRQLRAVLFRWRDDDPSLDRTSEKTIGMIAQEVQAVLPGAVLGSENNELSLNYQSITALLVEAIKDQDVRINTLEQRLAAQGEKS
jgi:hypothetical protein